MKSISIISKFSAMAAACLLSFAHPVAAQPTLVLSDGTNTITVVDNQAGDLNPAPGIVTFLGSIGDNWSLSVSVGQAVPALGTAAAPAMDLSVSVQSSGPGTITVWFSDDYFGPTNGATLVSIGGLTQDTATYSVQVSDQNTEFTGLPLVPDQTFQGGLATGGVTGNINLQGPYALTQKVVVTHNGAGHTGLDASISVTPNPNTGTIGDFVWNDLNHNGVQDANEPGIDGVTVKLEDSTGNVLATTTTSNNGYYQFGGLSAGTYMVAVDNTSSALVGLLPTYTNAGTDTTVDSNPNPATVTLATDSSSDETIDFGYYLYVPPTGEIGDFVWLDLNQNGIQDAGEPGIAGVTLNLKDSGGNIVATTVTDANGAYLFTGLSAGNYTVCVVASTLPAGLTPTVSTQGTDATKDSNGSPAAVNLATNSSIDLSIDFGYIPPSIGSIGDFVWLDLNGDGLQDQGEPGIAGVTVNLYLGTSATGAPLKTTTTDLDGYYKFNNLEVDQTYTVAVVLTSAPLANTTPSPVSAPGTNTADDSNPNPWVVSTLTVATPSDTTVDFGFVPNPTGKIGDFVWRDVNHNGIQDAGEPGIANVTVNLKDTHGNVLATTTTDSTGHYLFTGLRAGNYVVQVDGTDSDLAGLIPTIVNAKNSTSAIDSNPNPSLVTLATDSSIDLTIDFGFYAPGCGCIGDYVWYDCDGDGVQDYNEVGIPGVTVKLYWGSVLLGTQVTDSTGHYLFTGLPAGTYTVTIDNTQSALAAYKPTKIGGTSDKALDSNPNPATVTLATSKSSDLTIDFGYIKPCPPCPITTCSPGNWCNKNNWFCQGFSNNFCRMYPCGLNVGSGKCLKFNTCQSVCSFLPCYGSGNCLQQSFCNPSTQIGCLAGNVVCLHVAVDCSKAGITGAGLGNCKLKSGKFAGWTVCQLLDQAEACLSGSRLPYGCSYQDLSDACNLVNCNYDLGKNCGNLVGP